MRLQELIVETSQKREVRVGWALYRAWLVFPYLSQREAAEAVAVALSLEYPHLSKLYQTAADWKVEERKEESCGRYSFVY